MLVDHHLLAKRGMPLLGLHLVRRGVMRRGSMFVTSSGMGAMPVGGGGDLGVVMRHWMGMLGRMMVMPVMVTDGRHRLGLRGRRRR